MTTEARTAPAGAALAQGVRDEADRGQHTELALRDEVLMPVDPQTARAAMDAYQATTAAILDDSDWQGRPGAAGSFVKKSGWRKVAKAYKLSTKLISRECTHDADGQPTRAEAVVMAIHVPSGQFAEADGYCSIDEARFDRSGGRAKIENDLRATATTRAKNRAISDLVGMGAVTAEEADNSMVAGPMMKSPDAVLQSVTDLGIGIGINDPAMLANEFVAWVVGQHGYLPQPVGRALVKLQRDMSKAIVDQADSDLPWSPSYEPPPEDDPEFEAEAEEITPDDLSDTRYEEEDDEEEAADAAKVQNGVSGEVEDRT